MSREVWVRSRTTGLLEREQQFSAHLFHFLFDTKVGLGLSRLLFSKLWFSRLYGRYQTGSSSLSKVDSFIERYQINMGEFEPGPFESFNHFFCRRFKPGARNFAQEAEALGSPAEGRLLAYQKASDCPLLSIKGSNLSLLDLVKQPGFIPSSMQEGPVLLLRLSPLDYHRFHAPDRLHVDQRLFIPGDLFTVHPLGWKHRPNVFFLNQREALLTQTANFGRLLYMAIGGFVVGKIHPSKSSNHFERGEEMGWFEMGGSTILIVGEPGAFEVDPDLLESTRGGTETFVRLGETIARKSKNKKIEN